MYRIRSMSEIHYIVYIKGELNHEYIYIYISRYVYNTGL